MSNRILSYRGLLADGGQDELLLTTKKGEIGYRITKFQIMNKEFGASSTEHTVQIFKVSTTPSAVVDFSDNRLLGAATIANSTNATVGVTDTIVIFDQEIFNQDIFITHIENANAEPVNYYLELEVIKLDESQAMVATLKDIRNNS